mmetsp:Transcript_96243/g.281086  ORF Transcript_96243/g.281086 Transcript_96243/m.281086 type:complete len:607 (-) Transcript_96243:38-1858(-)
MPGLEGTAPSPRFGLSEAAGPAGTPGSVEDSAGPEEDGGLKAVQLEVPQIVFDTPRQQHRLSSLMNAAIDEIGAGPYQLVVLLLGGGVYMAEGSFLLMLSIVAKSLIAKWDLSPLAAGAMASVLFAGLLAGTITGGFACDRYGRRLPILVTYLGIAVFTILGIAVPGLLPLLAAKLLLGFCLGFGVPASNAIVAESCPPAQRSNIYCMTMVLFSLGQLYSATVVWIISPTLQHQEMDWRAMLAASTVLPLVLLVLAYIFLEESPHWLMLHCRISAARAVVSGMLRYKRADERMERYADLAEAVEDQLRTPMCTPKYSPTPHRNAGSGSAQAASGSTEQSPLLEKMDIPEYVEQPPSGWMQQLWQCLAEARAGLGALFSESYRLTTLIMLCVTFSSNFAYYGMIYGLPDTLKRAHMKEEASWSPAAGLFLSAVFEIPGVFLAIVLAMTIGRRTNMAVAFFGCAGALVGVVAAISLGRVTGNAGLLSMLFVKLFLATGYIVVYLYLLECYPTKFRATGLAFCMVLGRLGAAICPFLYDGLAMMLGTDSCFFLIMATMMAGAAVACCFLPYETKDAILEEDAPPGSCTPVHEVMFLPPSADRRRKSFSG